MSKAKSVKALELAGWVVLGVTEGRWYEVERPGKFRFWRGVILRQGPGCWHWFSRDEEATTSGTGPDNVDRGGLGDAVDSDSAMKTYSRLVRSAPLLLQGKYTGLRRASSDCYQECQD